MPRVVRRPRAAVAALGLTLAVGALAGCAGIGQPAPYDSPGINGLVIPTPSADAADFVAGVDNPWFPLEPGSTARFDVTEDGADLGWFETTVLDGTTDVGGIAATGVTTASAVDGRNDISTYYYAQDTAGNVWLVGADEGGVGSWRAGEDGAQAGLAVPAHPRLGDGWLTRVVPGLGEESTRVEDQSRAMVQTRTQDGAQDDDEAGTTTRHVYERGVGLVSVEDLDAGWTARRAGSSD
ncbi:MAG: hypothetical protein ACKOVB_22905 [Terrabacter sp.]